MNLNSSKTIVKFVRIPVNDHGMKRGPATNAVLCVSNNERHRDLVASYAARTEGIEMFFAGTAVDEVASLCDEVAPQVICFSRLTLSKWLHMFSALELVYSDTPLPKLVLISENIEATYIYRILSYGFDDVVDTDSPNVALDDSLRAGVDPNERACSKQIVRGVDPLGNFRSKPLVYSNLVDYRIAGMVAAGYTDREIADVVNFSHQVVRNRISAMLLRSGIRNRTHLAFYFLVEKLREE